MNKKAVFYVLAMLLIPILLVGCGSRESATPTTNPDLIYTAAAQTADARLTQIFQSTPSVTPVTPSPTFDATQTAVAQTAVAVMTQVANPTPTSQVSATAPVAPTAAGSSADKAVFVSDVTIPDGSIIAPGASFVKTWKLQNAGTSTWNTSYSLVFISGDQMGTIVAVPLTQSVAPGQQVELSVNMAAPTNTGKFQGFWRMKNDAGQLFSDSVYVLINVGSGSGTAAPTSTGSAGSPVSSLSMSVDEGTYIGQCPHTFSFAATFTLGQAATLTYNLEAFSDTPGFSFNLPGAQTNAFSAGTYSLSFPLEFTDSGSGWVRFHITAPVNLTSNQVSFNLTCSP